MKTREMEIHRSLSKRSFSSSSNGGFNPPYGDVCEDFFGTEEKSGIPVLAPSFESYSEIFDGFHSSRSSSIPVLHIPLIQRESGLHFDVQSPDFDYAEIFVKVGGSAVTASFQDVHGQSSGGSCFSDDSRSSLQSMTNELDPLFGSIKIKLPDVDAHHPFGSTKQINASQSKPCRRNVKAVLTKNFHVSSSPQAPGYGFSFHDIAITLNDVDQPCSIIMEDDVKVEKHLQEPLHGSGSQELGRDSKPFDKLGTSSSVLNKTFMSISDISLRTKPSKLPPPSRPPPGSFFIQEERDRLDLERKSLESYDVEMTADEKIFHDVEVDETCKQRSNKYVELVQANNMVSLEGDFFGCTSMQMDVKPNDSARVGSSEEEILHSCGKPNDSARVGSSEEEILHSCGKAASVYVPVPEDSIASRKDAHETSKSRIVDMVDHKPITDSSTNSVSWRELAEYFRTNEKKKTGPPVIVEDSVASGSRNTRLYQEENELVREGSKDCEVTSDVPRYDDEMNHPGVVKAKSSNIYNLSKNDNGFQNQILNQLSKKDNLGVNLPGSLQVYGENEKVKTLPCATVEGISEAVDNVNFMEPKIVRSAFPTEFEVEERFLDVPIWELNSWKPNTNTSIEEGQRLPKVVEQVKSSKGLGKVKELQGIEKSRSAVSLNEKKKKQLQGNEVKKNRFVLTDSPQGPCIIKANERCGAAQRPPGSDLKGGLAYVSEDKVNESMNTELHEQVGIDLLKRTGHWREVNSSVVTSPGEVYLNLLNSRYKLEANVRSDFGRQGNIKATSSTSTGENEDSKRELNCINESHSFPKCGIEDSMKHKIYSALDRNTELDNAYTSEDDGGKNKGTAQLASRKIDIKGMAKESQVNEKRLGDSSSGCENNDATSMKTSTGRSNERKDKNVKRNIVVKGHESGVPLTGESVMECDSWRKIEEEKEREREREKDRMAVDKTALEVKPRTQAGGRVGLQISSIETRLRAEKAAVERATTEARQRATEKLMTLKASDLRVCVDISSSDRHSTSAKPADSEYSSLPFYLHFHSAGAWRNLQHSSSSLHDGAEVESPQRCKARQERYQRTADRVANALAEKNKQDLIAQREIEERNKIAEALDAEFKRWSRGKEGNLRALLSTVQYILGPESGWQPIALTEIVTCAAVKKAYKKATLYVHPDKLQQRGATVQHKYICEKVFDLLKESWNKFNSQEC